MLIRVNWEILMKRNSQSCLAKLRMNMKTTSATLQLQDLSIIFQNLFRYQRERNCLLRRWKYLKRSSLDSTSQVTVIISSLIFQVKRWSPISEWSMMLMKTSILRRKDPRDSKVKRMRIMTLNQAIQAIVITKSLFNSKHKYCINRKLVSLQSFQTNILLTRTLMLLYKSRISISKIISKLSLINRQSNMRVTMI